MSDESKDNKAEISEQTEDVVTDNEESQNVNVVEEEAQTYDEQTDEVELESDSEDQENDLVADAMKANEALKAELEALKNADKNVFEENELLKKELEDAKKLAEMEVENKKLQAELEGIKRNSLIESMIASGQLNNDLREWAQDMSLDKLQAFAKSAPKKKTILDQKNNVDRPTLDMEEWRKQQMKGRIIS